MTALIMEDEIPAGKYLERLLIAKGFIILDIVNSVKCGLKWLKENNQPDLIFTDIKLRDGLCFEIFEKIPITAKVVFTTAYDEFALKAFEYNSVDYLLKPIDENKLGKMISKIDFFRKPEATLQWGKMADSVQNTYQRSFLIHTVNAIKKVDVDSISCFFSEHNATYLMTNYRQFPVKYSLEHLETILSPEIFFRVNRKYIIRKNAITNVSEHGTIRFKCHEDEDIPVSRQKLKAFIEWYKK